MLGYSESQRFHCLAVLCLNLLCFQPRFCQIYESVEDRQMLDLIDRCPDAKLDLFMLCYQETSCWSHCGKAIDENILSGFEGSGSSLCHCDVDCLLYRDCCPDFRNECPELYNTAVSLHRDRLDGVSMYTTAPGCVQEYSVICECPESGNRSELLDLDPKTQLSPDVVVTELHSGIHYKNLSVFFCHHVGGDFQLLPWKKLYVGPTPKEEDVTSYLRSRVSSKEFLSRVRDDPPAGVIPRYGWPRFDFSCVLKNKTYANCHTSLIKTYTLPSLCEKLKEYGLTTASVPYWQTVPPSIEYTPIIVCDGLIYRQPDYDYEEEFKAAIELKVTQNSFQILQGSDFYFWTGIQCNSETEKKDCDLKFVCGENYTLAGDQCVILENLLIVSLYQQPQDNSTRNSSYAIKRRYVHGPFILVGVDQYPTEEGYVIYGLYKKTINTEESIQESFRNFRNHAVSITSTLKDQVISAHLCVLTDAQRSLRVGKTPGDFYESFNCLDIYGDPRSCSEKASCLSNSGSPQRSPDLFSFNVEFSGQFITVGYLLGTLSVLGTSF